MTSHNPNKNYKIKPDYRSAEYRCGIDRNSINPNGFTSTKIVQFWNLMREFGEGIRG